MARKRQMANIESHLPLVHEIAGIVWQRARVYGIDRDDLFQEGVIGLMKVLPQYDPDRSVPRTFLGRRIRGAMLDFVRSETHSRRIGTAMRIRVEAPPERSAADPAFAWFEANETLGTARRLVRGRGRSQAETRASRERFEVILEGVLSEWSMWEIAGRLKVDPSRVSQLYADALGQMREAVT
jgi:RNA polymerase sigma factor (sigma-70 family)